MSDNKIRKLRFKNEDGKEYGEWEEKKLKDTCSFYSGGTPDSNNSKYYNGNIPFIKSGEIHLSKTESFISDDGYNNSSAKMVNKGDILYALYGATSGEVDLSKINGAINQAILCIRTDKFDNLFLVQLLNYHKNEIICKYLQGGQGNLSGNIIKELKFNIPDIEEQKKIAEFFSKVDEKIEIQSNKVEELEKVKRGLMQKIFSRELRFKDEDGKEFGEWINDYLGNNCEIIKGSPISKDDLSDSGSPCILYGELYTRYGYVINNVISNTNKKEPSFVRSKVYDVLIPSSGETPEDISTASCLMVENVILGGDMSIIRSNNLNGIFLSCLLNYKLKFEIARVAQGASIVHLYPNHLKKLKIPIPALQEQKKIADFLSKFDEKIEIEKKILEKWKTVKKGLLQQMFV